MNLAQRRNEECSSLRALRKALDVVALQQVNVHIHANQITDLRVSAGREPSGLADRGMIGEVLSRSEEHTSELQSLLRISYAVFCLPKITHHYKYIQINCAL